MKTSNLRPLIPAVALATAAWALSASADVDSAAAVPAASRIGQEVRNQADGMLSATEAVGAEKAAKAKDAVQKGVESVQAAEKGAQEAKTAEETAKALETSLQKVDKAAAKVAAKAEAKAKEKAAKAELQKKIEEKTKEFQDERQKAVDAAKTASADAEKVVASAKEGVAKAEGAVADAKKALAAVKADKKAAPEAVAKAKEALAAAEKDVDAAEANAKAARRNLSEKQDALEDAKDAFDRAGKDAWSQVRKDEKKRLEDEEKAERAKRFQSQQQKKDAEKAARTKAEQERKDKIDSKAKELRREREKVLEEKNELANNAARNLEGAKNALADINRKIGEAQNAEDVDVDAVKRLKAERDKAKADVGKAEDALKAAKEESAKASKAVADSEKDAKEVVAQEIRDADKKKREENIGRIRENRDTSRATLQTASDEVERLAKEYNKAADDCRSIDRLIGQYDKLVGAYADVIDPAKPYTEQLKAAQGQLAAAKDNEKQAAARKIARLEAFKPKFDAICKDTTYKPEDPIQNLRRIWEKDREGFVEKRNKAEETWIAARNRLNDLLPGSHHYRTDSISVEQAMARLKEVVRSDYSFQGDVCWFAGTSVDGMPLYEMFREGAALDCVEKARRLAIEGGFYFVGFADADTQKAVTSGTTKFLVDKGRIGPVSVSTKMAVGSMAIENPDPLFTEEQIKSKMGIEEGSVFNYQDIQKNFFGINSHPDVQKADLVFTPGLQKKEDQSKWPDYKYEDGTWSEEKDRVIAVDVDVYEKEGMNLPFFHRPHLVLGIDNFGSLGELDSPVGEADAWMGRATLQFLDVGGWDHALTLNGSVSLGGSLWGVAGSYLVPRTCVDSDFFPSITVHGGYTSVSEDEVVPLIDVEGSGWYAGALASWRLHETDRSLLDGSVGLTMRHVDSALIYGGERLDMGLNGEGYDILPLSLALSYSDAKLDSCGGRNYATAEFVYNVGGSDSRELGAFRQAILDEDNANYFLTRFQAARIQLLGDWENDASKCWFLFARADAQFSDKPLIGAEQYGLGGHGTVRGYAERSVLGDTGFSGTIELRTPIYVGFLENRLGWGSIHRGYGWDRIQGVLFFDAGYYQLLRGRNNTDDDDDFLYSVGLGLRMAVKESIQFRADWGMPLNTDDVYETSDAGRFSISLSAQF